MKKYTDNHIRDFLRRKLREKESADFKERLTKDDALKKRTDEMKDVLMLGELSRNDRTRELIRELKASKHKKNKMRWWAGGVILLLLLIGAFLLWTSTSTESENPLPTPPVENTEAPIEIPILETKQDPPSPPASDKASPKKEIEQLSEPKQSPAESLAGPDSRVYAARITDAVTSSYTLPPQTGVRGEYKDTLSMVYQILADPNGDSQNALKLLSPITERDTAAQEVKVALAHAYFAAKDYTNSAAVFASLVNGKTPFEKDTYEWNLLLAMIARDGRESSASLALLEKMLDSNEFHNQEAPARQLRKKLRDIEE